MAERGEVLDSLPSGSSGLYASAEDDSLPSHSRASSFSARRRSSDAVPSRASSATSMRTGATADTASSPERRPRGGAAAGGACRSIGSLDDHKTNGSTVADTADQLASLALDQKPMGATKATAVVLGTQPQVEQQQQQQQREHQQQQQQREQQQVGRERAAVKSAAPAPLAGKQQQPAAPPTGAPGQQASTDGGSTPSRGLAAPGSPPPPGAALFSVPMASAPTTGIYGIPQEMLRIRDLDAGKEYSLDQRYWIKDMDTGQVYVLESGEGGRGGGGGVTELLSGRELSQAEFEDALGFFKVPQPAPLPAHMLPASSSDGALAGGVVAASAVVQQAAQKSLRSFTSGANWVKANVSGVISNLKQGSPLGSERGAGSPSGPSAAQRSGTSSPPSLLDDRQGQPVKVQVYRKSYREFTDLRLVQQLGGHQGVVWTMKFSRNGRFLASAGQDCVIRVWEVAPSRGSGSAPGTPMESEVPLDDAGAAGAAGAGAAGSPDGRALLADPAVAVFQRRPYRVYRGHKQDVLDLCWSKTQFLLSASMDKTVRLWHVSMDECLRVFKHTDFVTAIDFHPLDDKMFLSGSIDGKVRLWNIPEQRVVSWQDVHEMVTAVTYSLDGRKAVVGTMKGKCRFYTIEKSTLEYEAQLDVKNKRGQHSRGKKITGLAFLPSEPGKLLITSNDSRVRLYDGYTLRCKYKGHTNRNTQIRASFSPGGDYITCGSDDGWVYVWGTRKSDVPPSGGGVSAFQREPENPLAKEKNASYECFQANGDVVTVAIFAPASCHRSAESMSPTAGVLRHQRSNSLGDRSEGEAAMAAARARGQVLVTAGYTGEIKVYENIGLPQWL